MKKFWKKLVSPWIIFWLVVLIPIGGVGYWMYSIDQKQKQHFERQMKALENAEKIEKKKFKPLRKTKK